ncbi:MAG TPA: hypothetical protein PKA10_11260 [Selenomonadales bacterium]|nr:hypothetical protein [Selenomonadales bacterium]
MTAKDIGRLLENCPSSSLLAQIGAQARRSGSRAAVVGGFVRDLLLGTASQDIDIVVEGSAVVLARQLSGLLQGRLVKASPFGTALLALGDQKIDFAAARTEYYAHPGALPVVTPASIPQDLFRRDFTVNALAVELLGDDGFGPLLDPCGGVGDLGNRRLRILHAGSFQDDPTRIFRALRLANRLKFTLDTATEELLREAIKSQGWRNISSARLMRELRLMFDEPDWVSACRDLERYGLFAPLFGPALTEDWAGKLEKVDPAVEFFTGQGLAVDRIGLAGLCLKAYFLLPARLARQIRPAVERLPDTRRELAGADRPHKIFAALAQIPPPVLAYLWIICQNGEEQRPIRRYVEELRHVKPGLSAAQIAAQSGSGPQVKMLYNKLLTAKLDGRLPTLEDEREFIQRLAAESTHGGL